MSAITERQSNHRKRMKDEPKKEVVKAIIYVKHVGEPWGYRKLGRPVNREVFLNRGSKSKGRISDGREVKLVFGKWHYVPE